MGTLVSELDRVLNRDWGELLSHLSETLSFPLPLCSTCRLALAFRGNITASLLSGRRCHHRPAPAARRTWLIYPPTDTKSHAHHVTESELWGWKSCDAGRSHGTQRLREIFFCISGTMWATLWLAVPPHRKLQVVGWILGLRPFYVDFARSPFCL